MALWEKKHKPLQFHLFQGIIPLRLSRVPADLIAGITLAALAIPEVIGYTKISGTPEITGLYTILIPMTLYALFGASRHLVVGADSATAAILASSLAGIAVPKSSEWLALSSLVALMAAIFLLLARFARLGFLSNFLSRTVLIGFLSGVGLQVSLGEIAGMLDLPNGKPVGVIPTLLATMQQVDHANVISLTMAVSVLVVIVGLRKISKNIPGALIAIAGATAISWVFNLKDFGVHLLGPVSSGLPKFGLPDLVVNMNLIEKLIPTAFSIFVVILAQSAGTSQAYATRNNESFDANQDLVGLCLANIGAGLSGTFVVNGSPTKTEMVESAGGQSQLAQLTTSFIVLLVLLFLTGPLTYLPMAVLSAVVFLIGMELIDISGMRRIYKERPWEFWVAVITAVTVVFMGVEQSILLAAVLSLMVHTRHGYLVNNMLLVPNTTHEWHQQPVATRIQLLPGLMIYRFMHNIYYANSQLLKDEIMGLIRGADPPLSWFCIDASAINDIDFTASDTLRIVYNILAERGIKLVICEVIDEVREELERSELVKLFAEEAFFQTPDAVISAFQQRNTVDNKTK